MEKQDLEDKIVLLKLKGTIEQGKTSDIKFQQIQETAKKNKCYVLLKNTNQLKTKETEIEIETSNIDKIEETIVSDFIKKNPSQFNSFLSPLINSFDLEKQEDERSAIFQSRLLSEINKILELNLE